MDSIEEMFIRNPLLNRSFYAQVQADNLMAIGKDISVRLSRLLRVSNSIDGKGFNKTYGYISLWIFGAYELVRSLDQKKGIFKPEIESQITSYKQKISKIRMPIAKYEFANHGGPINHEASVKSINFKIKDIQFEINGEVYSYKELYQEFKQLIKSIQLSSFN